MEIKITFRSMHHSNSLENYAIEHIQKIFKFLKREQDPLFFNILICEQKNNFNVEIRLNSKHFHLISNDENKDAYIAVDGSIDKMINEVKKAKDKVLDSRNHHIRELA